MKDWIKDLYWIIFRHNAKIKDLRSYISNNFEDVEWIEDDEYPRHEDDFRYGDIDRLIRHELHYAMKEK